MSDQFTNNVHGPFTADGLVSRIEPNFIFDTSKMDAHPHPDELFPSIADEDLLDGRTTEGKAQRKYLERRAAYIKLYEHAMSTTGRLSLYKKAFEILDDLYVHTRQVSSRRIQLLEQDLDESPAVVMMTFQIALLLQMRPEEVSRTQGSKSFAFKLGSLGITVACHGFTNRIKIVAAGMADKEFQADSKGNLDKDELARLVGHLAMAGITIDPQLVRLVMSMRVEAQVYKNTGTPGILAFFATEPTTLMRDKPNYQ
jgi:hypothetical protein